MSHPRVRSLPTIAGVNAQRQIVLVGLLQAQNCTTIPPAWRHPEARHDVTSFDYYRHIGQVLEAGCFDPGFFDDRLAMPDMFGGDHRTRWRRASAVWSSIRSRC